MRNFKSPKYFIASARKGDRYVYHTGILASDRKIDKELDYLALNMMTLYEEGACELYQRKLGKNSYEYIAERCIPAKKNRTFTGCYANNTF